MSIKQASYLLHLQTRGKGLYEFTGQVAAWIRERGAANGLLTVLCQHTSASLVIQENADPDSKADLEEFMQRLVPFEKYFRHTCEGTDDMPSHIKSVLSEVTLSIPVIDGDLALGQWQSIYLWEHRDNPNQRKVMVTVWE